MNNSILSAELPKKTQSFKGSSYRDLKYVPCTCMCILFLSFLFVLFLNYNYLFIAENFIYSIALIITCVAGLVCCVIISLFVHRIKQSSISAENELYENKERYKLIIAASNTGAWEYHSDTDYQWCSPEYFEMLGYDRDTFVKENEMNIQNVWINFLHPEDKSIAIKEYEDYMKGTVSGMYESFFRLRHRNGGWRWIWSRGQALRKSDGTISSITLGTHIDITEKKNLEIELLRHNKKLLKYAYLNAHEVRGPLARILGLIGLTTLTSDIDYLWFFEKIRYEANDIDRVLKMITQELNEIDEHKSLYEE